MALVVVRAGLLTTVQDRGRVGYRRFGVPTGGAFDRAAFDLANALLGNSPEAAALELTMFGGTFRAEVDLAIALAGAPMRVTTEPESGESRRWSIPTTGTLRAGETLVIGGSEVGARSYLAVRGGWQTRETLGSRSTEVPILSGARLMAQPGSTTTRWPSSELVAAGFLGDREEPIRRVDGPDHDAVTARLEGPYRVLDQSNRVGVRLDGPPVPVRSEPNRVSRPVSPGAIQIAGDQPIILGVAGGTIGGYPHVGHVIAVDLDRVAQLRPGDLVRFERVDLTEARRLDAEAIQARRVWQSRMAVWAGV